MKRLIAIVLGFALAATVAAEEVNRTLDASADGHVHISNISGSVSVSGWSRDQVEVTGEIGPKVEELIFERSGDKVTIKVKVPRKSGRGIESHLRVQVPAGSSIDVGTVSADIEVTGVLGEQKLEAVSGDIETDCDDADVSAGTVSGDVIIRGNGKDAETHSASVSGDVELHRLAGEVFAESVSGDLTIEEGSFDRASFNVVNGDIVFRSELRDGGKLKAESVNGEIELRFSGSVSGQFDVDTFNGDIDNCFGPKAKRTSKYAPGMELSFTEGDGDARVTVSTVNGDISICR
jgi:DUF4097 and DUF4098 domain-containing protein YvlB